MSGKSTKTTPNAVEAFLARMAVGDGCHLWTGPTFKHRGGYGSFTHRPSGRVMQRAHRAAWELFCEPIPAGMSVLHRCDNRLCVRLDHLFLGTQRDNMQDMARKGRQAQKSAHGMFLHGRYVGQKKDRAYPTEPVI